MYYEVSDEDLEFQFLALKNAGIIHEHITLEQFREVTLPIWPPGTPLPKNDRK